MSYAISFFGGGILLLAFAGWGNGLRKILRLNQDSSWPEDAALGMAGLIFLGGLLNLFGFISRPILLAQIFIGLLIFFRKRTYSLSPFRDAISKSNPLLLFLGLACVVSLLIYYAAWVAAPMNTRDDYQAYIIFPQKMIQAGSMGFEPFSERRFHLLGGLSYLQAMVLSFADLRSLHLIDPALTIVILAGLLWVLASRIGVSRMWALILILLFVSCRLPGNLDEGGGNISAKVIGPMLLAALFLSTKVKSRPVVTSLLLAGLCACKGYFGLFGVLYLAVTYLFEMGYEPNKLKVLKNIILTGLFTAVFLLPWFAASYRDIGTAFYPFLGKGFHRAAYGFPDYPAGFNWSVLGFLKDLRFWFLGTLAILSMKGWNPKAFKTHVALALALIGGIFTVAVLSKNNGRYWFPFMWGGTGLLLIGALSPQSLLNKIPYRNVAASILVLVTVWLAKDQLAPPLIQKHTELADFGLMNSGTAIVPDEIRRSYLSAQNAVPPSEKIVVRASYPFLMDFKRNTVFNAEYLALGPKPGLPVFQGGAAMATYFKSLGIRYVFYSHGDASGYLNIDESPRLQDKSPWIRTQYQFMQAFLKGLNELGEIRPKIYSDSHVFVVDLGEKDQ